MDDFRFWQTVLNKSFSPDSRKFLGSLTRFARGDVRDHIISGKKQPRTCVSVPRRFAAILLYIERWLKAPVQLEDGGIVPRTAGTPQGGVISPLLANLFLHYAFDMWNGAKPSAHSIRALCG
jgi:hypothetical protein